MDKIVYFYQEENECKNSESGHHCWHQENVMYTSYPPQISEICCWCGGTRIRQNFTDSAQKHGNFLGGNIQT